MITLIRAIPPSFEEGYCPANWSEFANKLFSEATFVFTSDVANSFYNYGPAEPTPDNRTFPWLRTIGGGAEIDRWYIWSPNYGAWISPYWPPPPPESAGFRIDWTSDETSLKNFDNPGGSANPITATTGPFWEVDHDFDARIAIGAGTLPLSSTIIGVGQNGGLDQLTITASMMPKHRHSITMLDDLSVSYLPTEPAEEGGFRVRGGEDLQFMQSPDPGGDATTVGRTRETGGNPTDAANKLNIVPPVRGVLKAKRTLRKYYAI